jgi:hypothetical protein
MTPDWSRFADPLIGRNSMIKRLIVNHGSESGRIRIGPDPAFDDQLSVVKTI